MFDKKWTIAATTLLMMTAAAHANASPSLADCKKLTDNFARLNCFDQIQVDAEKTEPAPQRQTVTAPVAQPQVTVPAVTKSEDVAAPVVVTPVVATTPTNPMNSTSAATSEDDFGMTKKQPKDAIEQLQAKVTAVKRDTYNKFVITFENKHVWRQSDSDYIDMRVGDVAIIEKASFGSFLMSNGRDNRKIRVKRVE